jgi:hypothetical protein
MSELVSNSSGNIDGVIVRVLIELIASIGEMTSTFHAMRQRNAFETTKVEVMYEMLNAKFKTFILNVD